MNKFSTADGKSPLIVAAEHGYDEIVSQLLEHPEVKVNKRDWEGETPLYAAASHNHTEVVKALLDQPTVDVNKWPKGKAYNG